VVLVQRHHDTSVIRFARILSHALRSVKSLVLCSCLVTLGFGPPVITAGHPGGLRMYPEQVQSAYRLTRPPSVGAKAALVIDLDSGQTLYAKRPNQPLPPASTAKLMTALLTVQRAGLDERVTISPRAAATPGSRMGLAAGETMTVRDLLFGLLLPSGNDAAVALAEHVAGDQAAFVRLMNETGAALGLQHTVFANAHGLDDAAQVSTAADLALLARAVFAYPLLAQIVATPTAQVAGRRLTNTNELLGAYRGADGVKTGTTDGAGECLVASVMRNGHRLLVVILGSTDRYADARALLDYATAGWQWQSVDLPANALAWTTGADGHAVRLRPTERTDLFLPAWQWPLVQVTRQLDAAAALTGTLPVGTLTLTLAGRPLGSAPLAVWWGP
jgi:D-alanyl-D-alanine carboxypeptidase (penicillin-binding protein 5/6)